MVPTLSSGLRPWSGRCCLCSVPSLTSVIASKESHSSSDELGFFPSKELTQVAPSLVLLPQYLQELYIGSSKKIVSGTPIFREKKKKSYMYLSIDFIIICISLFIFHYVYFIIRVFHYTYIALQFMKDFYTCLSSFKYLSTQNAPGTELQAGSTTRYMSIIFSNPFQSLEDIVVGFMF